MQMNKEQLEVRMLEAQHLKVLEEVRILKRTTLVVESIKVIGASVLGIGGVMAALAGFQLAEVKAEKAGLEMQKIQTARDDLKKEVAELETTKTGLEKINKSLRDSIAETQTELDKISDRMNAPALATNPGLRIIRQDLNATGLGLRTTTISGSQQESTTTMSALIEGLFSSKAGTRGEAYEQIMAQYATSPDLASSLLDHANSHRDNDNGIYNTLVVLSHMDRKTLQRDSSAIRTFAESVRPLGPRISERVDKLLSRLSNA